MMMSKRRSREAGTVMEPNSATSSVLSLWLKQHVKNPARHSNRFCKKIAKWLTNMYIHVHVHIYMHCIYMYMPFIIMRCLERQGKATQHNRKTIQLGQSSHFSKKNWLSRVVILNLYMHVSSSLVIQSALSY